MPHKIIIIDGIAFDTDHDLPEGGRASQPIQPITDWQAFSAKHDHAPASIEFLGSEKTMKKVMRFVERFCQEDD